MLDLLKGAGKKELRVLELGESIFFFCFSLEYMVGGWVGKGEKEKRERTEPDAFWAFVFFSVRRRREIT